MTFVGDWFSEISLYLSIVKQIPSFNPYFVLPERTRLIMIVRNNNDSGESRANQYS
jgi:hypothetical protein